MIFVTGDKHGQLAPFLHNPGFSKIKKTDVLVICGDFGFLWDKSRQEYKNLKWLAKRRYTIAFVDGCNDNMSIINEYPVSMWNGGHVRFISKNIVYLMQGELYIIENKKMLAFGGGFNSNLSLDLENNNNWWPEQFATKQYVENVIKNIEKYSGKFDLIVSHEAPSAITPCLENGVCNSNAINCILEEIRLHCTFKKWFFGKYHVDRQIPPKYYALFERLVRFE